jgi:DNA-binding GntR family transcriptional regulator
VSKVRRSTLKDQAYDEILNLIVSGSLPLGHQIDERVLAERLDVSRTPLREAVGSLANDGLVEYKPYRGHFVRMFSFDEVNGLFEVRRALEGLAVSLAVPKMSQENIAQLTAILDDAAASLELGDMAAFSNADRAFHEMLARLSENQTLIQILNRLSKQIQIARVMANRDPDVLERTSRERPAILAALRDRDAGLAARLMEEHIAGVQRSVLAQLRTQAQQDATHVEEVNSK